MQGIAAVYRGIVRTKAQLEESDAGRRAALREARDAKSALVASEVELERVRLKNQELQTSLAAARTELETTKAELETTKAEAQAATETALEAERAVSERSIEDLFYRCWAFNPDADFSFMPPDLWADLLPKLQARLNAEIPPSETGEASAAAEQGETATSKRPTDGA